MQNHSLNQRKTERGQSFAEFGLSLVFLLVLLSVMVDLAWAFYTLIAMRDTVQEAAVFGSICPNSADTTKVKERLVDSASQPLNMSDVDAANDITVEYVNVDVFPGLNRGDSIKVTLEYDHQIIVPFVAAFINTDKYPLKGSVINTLLRNDLAACN